MHARLLTYIDEVARQGSIRGASEKLNVAASAISRQIRALEEDIGTPIFDRTTRSLSLTSAGEILVRHIRDTFRDMHRARAMIEDLKGLRRGEVVLAVMSGLAANLVPRTVLHFRRANPRVTVKVQLLTTGEEILEAVATGKADLGLGFDFPDRPTVRSAFVVLARLGAVMAPDHPLADRSSIRMSECVDHPLILADATTAIRPHLDGIFERQKISPAATVETNSIEVMRQLAAMGGGITFLTPFDIEAEVSLGRLTYVPVHELAQVTQHLSLIEPERSGSALASIFAENMKSALV